MIKKVMMFLLLLGIFSSIIYSQTKKLTLEQAYLYGEPHLLKSLPKISNWMYNENSYIAVEDLKIVLINLITNEKKILVDYEKLNDALPKGLKISSRAIVADDYSKFILSKDNDIYLFSSSDKSLLRLTNDEEREKNPTFSPDLSKIAYTKNHNLFVYDIETKKEMQLTYDGSDMILNGYASWVYYEEILGRASHYRAFYWSPDSKKISFLRFDDSNVPKFYLFNADGVHGKLEIEHYPKPGDPNPEVMLGVIDLSSKKIDWIDSTKNKDNYIAWIQYTKDDKALIYQRLNRGQDSLEIIRLDLSTHNSEIIYSENQKTWVNFFEDLYLLNSGNGFLLRSEKNGWYHIYHYSFSGKLINQITSGDWAVKKISFVDEKNNRIYFEAGITASTNKDLYSIAFDGNNLTKLTNDDGTNSCTVIGGGRFFFDKFSSIDTPPKLYLYDILKNSKEEIDNSILPEFENYILGKTELFTIPTSDGYNLPAKWILPPDFDELKKYPVIFSIYGGPAVSTVSNSFSRRGLGNYYLAQNGIIVISVDNRGSGHFGKRGENELFRNLGKWEIDDLVTAAKWLRKKPFVDTSKIAITGGSYGGYTTSMALARAGKYFKYGIAKYAVTDWRLYDNIYTERYMDTPEENPDGYNFGSVVNHAEEYKGGMLITHGTLDDNVHMQNTIQLIDKLENLDKDFELMLYPNQRHGIRYPKYPHSVKLDVNFWFKNLLNK